MESGGKPPERTNGGASAGRGVAEEQYRVALEAAGHLYFEYDPRSARIVVGRPWTLLGYGADERSASMDAWMELVHPEDRAAPPSSDPATPRPHQTESSSPCRPSEPDRE